jgi:hypothetical protein
MEMLAMTPNGGKSLFPDLKVFDFLMQTTSFDTFFSFDSYDRGALKYSWEYLCEAQKVAGLFTQPE